MSIKKETRLSAAPTAALGLLLHRAGQGGKGTATEGGKQAQPLQKAEFQSSMTQEKQVPPTAVPGPGRGQ